MSLPKPCLTATAKGYSPRGKSLRYMTKTRQGWSPSPYEANPDVSEDIIPQRLTRSNSKRLSATARALGIRILKLETPSNQGITKVQFEAIQVQHALGIDDTLETFVFLDHVILRHILLQKWSNDMGRHVKVKSLQRVVVHSFAVWGYICCWEAQIASSAIQLDDPGSTVKLLIWAQQLVVGSSLRERPSVSKRHRKGN